MDYLKLALNNMIAFGDTDILPSAYEYTYLKKKEKSLNGVLALIKEIYAFEFSSLPITVERDYGNSRIVMLIDPLLHLDYLATAIKIAEKSENKRVPINENRVHSYRFSPDLLTGKLFDIKYGFHSFKEAISFKAESFNGLVVKIDIRSFYPSILPEIIKNVLEKNGICITLIEKITSLINTINSGVAKGLPIGGNASRILAELVLNEIDQYLIYKEIDFIRFVDDFVIFVPHGKEIKVIDLLNEKLKELKLNINYSKLNIYESSHLYLWSDSFLSNIPFYNDTDTFVEPEQAELLIRGQIENIKEDNFLNWGLLKSLNKEISINRVALQVAGVLGFLHKGFGIYIQWVLNHFDIIDDEVFDKIYSAISNLLINNHSVINNEINKAFAIRFLVKLEKPQTVILLDELYQQNENNELVKLNIIHVFARWQKMDWLQKNIKDIRNLNLWQRRALLMNLKNRNSIFPETELTPLEILLWS